MRYALCPMPYALCPMPYARRVPHVTEKGYIMSYRLTIISRSGRVFEIVNYSQVLLAHGPIQNRGPSTGHDIISFSTDNQLSTVNGQQSTVNSQPSTVNSQRSTVNRQRSTVNRQLFAT
ncbi:hypothetical protein [Microcoleus sp.]|uniref:hypothetical protein n=1 Tax=Microcoleus sp. TaxID=44472 RepID=UPI00403ED099